ncbi:putative acetylcholinesterase [Apostichopus japonicus]|uniref:Carboxylic ester hydrolase n=1 Tax=Stichopus japonicus TaxID=307972 RepID=A0A2G8KE55_STIJA|nr:putative acetylcholinesterase [Apostichopus japonicus]
MDLVQSLVKGNVFCTKMNLAWIGISMFSEGYPSRGTHWFFTFSQKSQGTMGRRLRSRVSTTMLGLEGTSFLEPLKVPQAENCLYLNIWTPEAMEGNNYAVLIWIHGGGFDWGAGTTVVYMGDALTAYNDVVMVSINYRLNGFGFLSTGDNGIPGNFGIWDQHEAIKWVHTHIAKFGGDPDRITLFGQSAGAGSVGFHIVSPYSRDYFNNGILMSGSPYWVGNNIDGARNSAFRAGRNLGCDDVVTSDQLLKCMQEIDEETFAYEMISTPSGPILDYDSS